MSALDSLDNSKKLIDEFANIYSSILQSANKFLFTSEIEEKSVIILRMIYAKTLTIRKLLDGIEYNYVEEKSEKAVVEPTTLFVIVRNVLELIYVFEYVFLMPDTKEKKEFAYMLYMYTGLKERLSFGMGDAVVDEKIRNTTIKANEAAERIVSSAYFMGLSAQSQAIIHNRLNSPHPSYRLMLEDNEVIPVDYEKACEGIGMVGDFFKHTYSYLSTHAHPTYLSLVQFKEAYIGEKPLHDGFAGLATEFLLSILSILIEDARKQIPYIEMVYQRLSAENKNQISYFLQLTRYIKEPNEV